MKFRYLVAAVLAVFLFVPAAPARADVVLTPYVGSLFGGDFDSNTPGNRVSYGATAAFMGGGIFGVELGFNFTPEFYQDTASTPDVSQASLMGNLIVGVPIGGHGGQVRPYVTGGLGLMHISADQSALFDRFSSNDFAVNFGGGIMAFFSEHVGIRGDVRYFRALTDDNPGSGVNFDFGDLDFWKWDVGAAFRF